MANTPPDMALTALQIRGEIYSTASLLVADFVSISLGQHGGRDSVVSTLSGDKEPDSKQFSTLLLHRLNRNQIVLAYLQLCSWLDSHKPSVSADELSSLILKWISLEPQLIYLMDFSPPLTSHSATPSPGVLLGKTIMPDMFMLPSPASPDQHSLKSPSPLSHEVAHQQRLLSDAYSTMRPPSLVSPSVLSPSVIGETPLSSNDDVSMDDRRSLSLMKPWKARFHSDASSIISTSLAKPHETEYPALLTSPQNGPESIEFHLHAIARIRRSSLPNAFQSPSALTLLRKRHTEQAYEKDTASIKLSTLRERDDSSVHRSNFTVNADGCYINSINDLTCSDNSTEAKDTAPNDGHLKTPGHDEGYSSALETLDIKQKILLNYSDALYYKLYQVASSTHVSLSWHAYFELAKRLSDRSEHEAALAVINKMPDSMWNLEVFKFLVYLYIVKRPRDLESAQTLMSKFFPVNPSEKHLLWFYYTSLVREAKWSECVDRYEDARLNSTSASYTFLDNAIMEVCLTYNEHDFGWSVYEKMREIDRVTPPIIMTICWRAFLTCAKDPDLNAEMMCTWEARSWAVYYRTLELDETSRKPSLKYIKNRLVEIVKLSPQTESRTAKIARLS